MVLRCSVSPPVPFRGFGQVGSSAQVGDGGDIGVCHRPFQRLGEDRGTNDPFADERGARLALLLQEERLQNGDIASNGKAVVVMQLNRDNHTSEERDDGQSPNPEEGLRGHANDGANKQPDQEDEDSGGPPVIFQNRNLSHQQIGALQVAPLLLGHPIHIELHSPKVNENHDKPPPESNFSVSETLTNNSLSVKPPACHWIPVFTGMTSKFGDSYPLTNYPNKDTLKVHLNYYLNI